MQQKNQLTFAGHLRQRLEELAITPMELSWRTHVRHDIIENMLGGMYVMSLPCDLNGMVLYSIARELQLPATTLFEWTGYLDKIDNNNEMNICRRMMIQTFERQLR